MQMSPKELDKIVDFCVTLGKTGYAEIKEVLDNGGRPLTEPVIYVSAGLDGVVRGSLRPEDVVSAKGIIPILGFRDENNVYSLVYYGELKWTGNWIHFGEGSFDVLKEPEGEVVASINRNFYPQSTVDFLEVVAMTTCNLSPETVDNRIREITERKITQKLST